MSKLFLQSLRAQAYRSVLIPAAVTLLISCILMLIITVKIGFSVLLGAGIWLLSQWLFANRLFANVSPRAAARIVRTLYLMEVIKLLLIVLLFLVTIKFLPVHAGFVLLGLVITQVIFWFTLFWIQK